MTKTQALIERFEKKFGRNYIVKSKPEDYIHKSVDNSYHISNYKKWLTQEINQLVEEERKTFIKILNLYGSPCCDSLHHSKKHRHGGLDDCPVEAEINSLIKSLKSKED